jgi:hypothetical protein
MCRLEAETKGRNAHEKKKQAEAARKVQVQLEQRGKQKKGSKATSSDSKPPRPASKLSHLTKKKFQAMLKPLQQAKIVWAIDTIKRTAGGETVIKKKLNEIRLLDAEQFPSEPMVSAQTGKVSAIVGKVSCVHSIAFVGDYRSLQKDAI